MLISLRHLKRDHLPDLSEATLYKLAKNGAIPSIRVGDRLLFDADAVLAALVKGCAGALEPGRQGGR